MPTLPNTGVITPTLGGDAGTWDDKNNAAWGNYDEHNHAAGNGRRITTAAINIDADLTFGGLYAPTNLHRLTFASIVALTGNNKSLFVNTADNELYWRSNTGTNVKLTAGNALNVAAFTGGFGSGYTSASAAADYDDSTEQYTFKQSAGGNWSRLGVGGIRLYEFGTNETLRVGLLAPAALGASYDVTLPAALPGSTQIMQLSSTGDVTASNTIANAVSMGNTLGVTGLITATAGLTCAANQSITVSGTGDIKHGDRVLSTSPLMGNVDGNAGWVAVSDGSMTAGLNAGVLYVPLTLRVGDRVKSVSYIISSTNGTADLSVGVVVLSATMSQTSIGSATSTNISLPPWTTVTINVTDSTIATGESAFMSFSPDAGGGAKVGSILVTYDRP